MKLKSIYFLVQVNAENKGLQGLINTSMDLEKSLIQNWLLKHCKLFSWTKKVHKLSWIIKDRGVSLHALNDIDIRFD